MATTVTKIIDPNSGAGFDYASMSAFEAGEDADIVTADQVIIGKCRCTGGTADTTAVTFGGWTCDATRYVQVWTDTSETYRHNGTYQTGNKYRLNISGSSTTSIQVTNTNRMDLKVIGIEFLPDRIAAGAGMGPIAGSSTAGAGSTYVVDKCMFNYSASSTGQSRCITGTSANITWTITNNIARLYRANTIIETTAGGTVTVYNNTLVGDNASTTTGYSRTGGTWTSKNNIGQDISTCFGGSTGQSYNLSDDATATGTGSVASTTLTFADKAGGDLHLASSDTAAMSAGLGPSSDAVVPTTDIDDDDRSGTFCDIGADETTYSRTTICWESDEQI